MFWLFFFFKQKTAYEIMPSLVGSEMCIRDRPGTVITIPDNAGWPAWKPLISGQSVHNVTIQNIELFGNDQRQDNTRVWYGHSGKEAPKRWGQGLTMSHYQVKHHH